MRTAILAATILVTTAVSVPASAQYAPPKGQSKAAAMADESLILMTCTPAQARSRNGLPSWREPTRDEVADHIADRIVDRIAPPQADAECVARMRAMNAANPAQPSTLHAVSHYRGGYTALYVGGTHYCGDRQPMVAIAQTDIYPTYGCWKLTKDKKGVPAVYIHTDKGKSVLWKVSTFKRPDGSSL